jgi:thioredoxin-related protein
VLFITFSALTFAQKEQLTWHTDLSKASDLAIKEKKELLLFFTGSDWCGWCKKLQKDVLTKEEFVTWAKKNVILVELDFPRSKAQTDAIKTQNAGLAQQFSIQGYPTVWFVKPTKKKKTKNVDLAGLGSLGYESDAAAWVKKADAFCSK